MRLLRGVFLVSCLGVMLCVAWKGRWEGRLVDGNQTWIVDLGTAPVWDPPPNPSYEQFQIVFTVSEGLPAKDTPGVTIRRKLKLDWMATDLLLYLWYATVANGLLYLALRRERTDRILHLGLWMGLGLTAGAAFSFGLWLIVGGWGPPLPWFFGIMGLLIGIIVGLRSFRSTMAHELPRR